MHRKILAGLRHDEKNGDKWVLILPSRPLCHRGTAAPRFLEVSNAMSENGFQRLRAFVESPARDVPKMLDNIRHPLVLAGIAAIVTTGTVRLLLFLVTLFLDEQIARLARPLMFLAPLIGGAIGGLMAVDFSKLAEYRSEVDEDIAIETPDESLQTENARRA